MGKNKLRNFYEEEKNDNTMDLNNIKDIDEPVTEEVTEETVTEPAAPVKKTVTLPKGFTCLNVRSTPEAASNNAVMTLPNKLEVELLSEQGDWAFIRYNIKGAVGGEGWVMKKFLK